MTGDLQITGALTANGSGNGAGGSLTLTADNVVALNPGSTVTQVAFYQDANGDGVLDPGTDILLAYATRTTAGTWTLTLSGLTAGTYTLFGVAQDSYGVFGDPLVLTLTVI